MRGEKDIVVGGRSDPASIVWTAKAIEKMREADRTRGYFNLDEAESSKGVRSNPSLSDLFTLLLKGDLDIVVAEARDVPLRLQPKLDLGAVMERTNPFNVLIAGLDLILDEQPDDVCIAVSDRVSRGQLLYYRSDLQLVESDDCYEEEIRKMREGITGGFVTAASQVEARNRQDSVVEVFTSSICMPAAGQGISTLISRKEDKKTRGVLEMINHVPSFTELTLERMFLHAVSKDGKGPVGVLASVEKDEFNVSAVIVSTDGLEKISGSIHGWTGDEERLILKLADQLLESGGKNLIKNFGRTPEA